MRQLLLTVLACLALCTMAGCPADKKPKNAGCQGDKDCKDGQRCVNKICVSCTSDSDCPDGRTCQKGVCMVDAPECTADEQCADGEVCKNGQCQACESNGECGPGGRCQDGTCIRPKACKVDQDCADDEDCIDGRCLKPWKRDDTAGLTCQLETVFFDFDQWTVRSDARETLDVLAECMRKLSGDVGLYVYGHADENGTEEYNIALSEQRARAVADYLARLGIDPAQLRVVPKGELEPSGKGVEQDRRVEFEWR
ncbi:MAG: OmpA family protein [Myxococcota bacterium]